MSVRTIPLGVDNIVQLLELRAEGAHIIPMILRAWPAKCAKRWWLTLTPFSKVIRAYLGKSIEFHVLAFS
jgi:hypothetical protein